MIGRVRVTKGTNQVPKPFGLVSKNPNPASRLAHDSCNRVKPPKRFLSRLVRLCRKSSLVSCLSNSRSLSRWNRQEQQKVGGWKWHCQQVHETKVNCHKIIRNSNSSNTIDQIDSLSFHFSRQQKISYPIILLTQKIDFIGKAITQNTIHQNGKPHKHRFKRVRRFFGHRSPATYQWIC